MVKVAVLAALVAVTLALNKDAPNDSKGSGLPVEQKEQEQVAEKALEAADKSEKSGKTSKAKSDGKKQHKKKEPKEAIEPVVVEKKPEVERQHAAFSTGCKPRRYKEPRPTTQRRPRRRPAVESFSDDVYNPELYQAPHHHHHYNHSHSHHHHDHDHEHDYHSHHHHEHHGHHHGHHHHHHDSNSQVSPSCIGGGWPKPLSIDENVAQWGTTLPQSQCIPAQLPELTDNRNRGSSFDPLGLDWMNNRCQRQWPGCKPCWRPRPPVCPGPYEPLASQCAPSCRPFRRTHRRSPRSSSSSSSSESEVRRRLAPVNESSSTESESTESSVSYRKIRRATSLRPIVSPYY